MCKLRNHESTVSIHVDYDCILLIKKLQKSEEKNDEVKETDVERYVCYLSNKTIDLMKCSTSNRKTCSFLIQYLDKGRHLKCFTDNFWLFERVLLPSKLIWLKRT